MRTMELINCDSYELLFFSIFKEYKYHFYFSVLITWHTKGTLALGSGWASGVQVHDGGSIFQKVLIGLWFNLVIMFVGMISGLSLISRQIS